MMRRSEVEVGAVSPGGAGKARPAGVLVAEDDAPLRALEVLLLERAGFRVWPAAGGLGALGVYRAHAGEIDAVVSDLRMPGLDGLELLAALKAEDPGVRLMFVTAYAGEYDPDELVAAGAACVASKPFRLRDLVEAVRVVARNP